MHIFSCVHTYGTYIIICTYILYVHACTLLYVHAHIITLARLSCICMFEAMKMGGSIKKPGLKEYVCK